MVTKPTGDIEDKVLKDHLDSINQEMQQKIITLSATPTASDPLLDDGEIGDDGTDLWFRVGTLGEGEHYIVAKWAASANTARTSTFLEDIRVLTVEEL